MEIILTIGLVLLWFILGFTAFIINAKVTCLDHFDADTRVELILAMFAGPITFIIVVGQLLIDLFDAAMDSLLRKINKK